MSMEKVSVFCHLPVLVLVSLYLAKHSIGLSPHTMFIDMDENAGRTRQGLFRSIFELFAARHVSLAVSQNAAGKNRVPAPAVVIFFRKFLLETGDVLT